MAGQRKVLATAGLRNRLRNRHRWGRVPEVATCHSMFTRSTVCLDFQASNLHSGYYKSYGLMAVGWCRHLFDPHASRHFNSILRMVSKIPEKESRTYLQSRRLTQPTLVYQIRVPDKLEGGRIVFPHKRVYRPLKDPSGIIPRGRSSLSNLSFARHGTAHIFQIWWVPRVQHVIRRKDRARPDGSKVLT